MNPLNLSENSFKSLAQNSNNENSNVKKVMTVKEVAAAIGVSTDTIKNCIRRTMPFKMQNGKTTYLNENEVAVISKELKSNKQTLSHLTYEESSQVVNSTTELEIIANYKAANDAFVKLLEAKTAELERINAENKPKVEFYDDVTGSKDAIEMKEVAKVLNLGMGRNKIFEFLRDKKILDNNNQPYQIYVDKGYFRVIESKFTTPDGDVKINLKTVVMQKGLDFIRRQIKGLNESEIKTYRNKLANPTYMNNAINSIADRMVD